MDKFSHYSYVPTAPVMHELVPDGLRITLMVMLVVLLYLEASKIIMQYVAAVSGKGEQVDKVKEQLLQCNPILEGIVKLLMLQLM